MIPPAFIQDLLARTDVAEIVGRHVQLKKAGINYKGLCPFHGEKSPSFIVSPSRQTYHCFGCGVHGNAIGFLMEHGGLGFMDAVRDLAQQAGLTVPEDDRSPEEREQARVAKERQATLTDVLAKAGDHWRKQLKGNDRAVAYLKGRGLTGEIAARFGLGYAPEGWRGLASVFPRYDDPLLTEAGLVIVQGDEGPEQKRYDRFRDRIMFPIRSVQGDVIGFGGRVLDQGEPKYLNSPETPVFVKGRELYGLHEARHALRERGYALVVEGYMDVVALAQLGFPNAVATLGTACTAEHVHKLLRFTDRIVFSFDGDAAGRRAAGRALEAALPHATDTRSIKFLFLPTEHDPDSYVRERGAAAFETCVEQAVPLSRQLVEAAREGCELDSAEGRARLLANARPLWQALPDGALKRQLLVDLASEGHLPTPELATLWGTPAPARGAPPPSRAAPSRRPPRVVMRRPEDHVARLLLLNSVWWSQLSDAEHTLLCERPGWHGELFRWLDSQLHDLGPQPWSAWREPVGSQEWGPLAVQLVETMDLEVEPLLEDLRSAVTQVGAADPRQAAERVLGRL
ncbi:DNA primase [uncultured Methylibium sp.]|uniref:DNA primase n=1 Tax=uncultured Methylibium sp. TaxID=381093 RepID=UPI0025F76EFB|nr:DNA primase [uncultured Methylibium sp.]